MAKINDKFSVETIENGFLLERAGKEAIEDFCLHSEPFKCGILRNFLKIDDPSFLSELRSEVESLEFLRKENDLMSLSQSKDLSNLDNIRGASKQFAKINEIRKFLEGPVREWISEITGIELRADYVPLTASIYGYTDYLLCHDDELEDRRIAFVLYLSPDWSEADGGYLDIFDSSEDLEPGKVVHRLLPKENSFSFFEVSSKSFHQVSEVLAKSKNRISINGWFHGAPLIRPPKSMEALPTEQAPGNAWVTLEDITSWINPWYFAEENHPSIRKKFGRDSQIELVDFLKKEKYEAVWRELKELSHQKKPMSIPNKRSFSTLEAPKGSALEKLKLIMKSEPMFLIISQLTGVNFHPAFNASVSKKSSTSDESAQSSSSSSLKRKLSEQGRSEDPVPSKKAATSLENGDNSGQENEFDASLSRCSSQIRQFSQGDYTLLFDSCSHKGDEFCLDAQLFFTTDKWNPSLGGYTCYVAKDDEEEILTVEPRENSLALVYRDSETMRFIKYLNDRVNGLNFPGFFDISMVYYSGYETNSGSDTSEGPSSAEENDDSD